MYLVSLIEKKWPISIHDNDGFLIHKHEIDLQFASES